MSRRRRYVATTDSDHDQPIYPNRIKELTVDGPNQLWVADITYVAINEGFAYVAVILDAWSRRAVGYAISRSIDARLTLAALNAAIERLVGKQALELEFLKGAVKSAPWPKSATTSVIVGPRASASQKDAG